MTFTIRPDRRASTRILIVMGVSGAGKTSLGKALATHLQWDFKDGDDFHSKSNIEKMHAGKPLTDEDREPWLKAIRAWVESHVEQSRPGIIACSALKRRYRDYLFGGDMGVIFVAIEASRAVLVERLHSRESISCPRYCWTASLRTMRLR